MDYSHLLAYSSIYEAKHRVTVMKQQCYHVCHRPVCKNPTQPTLNNLTVGWKETRDASRTSARGSPPTPAPSHAYLHTGSAIDTENLAINPLAVLRREKADDAGDVDGQADAVEG